ncbi:MAG TPA: type II toxin-antitoxin system VapC family toxin [Thermoanaerobaculia bacterium]|jgi:predicted nucleic acid-binding protein|nr:type II toxin-antitoxin system VapC family toxin [Thermoanaerobaculia bacterium]
MPSLVDTSVLSEFVRPEPNRGVKAWAADVDRIFISVVSIEEIEFGMSWKPNKKLAAWFENFFAEACESLPITDEIARRAGIMRGRFLTKGITRSPADMLIAATAHIHGLTLVTRNVRDFDGCAIKLLNPFL